MAKAVVPEMHMVRFKDKVVVSASMCRDSGPNGGHTCFKDKHPIAETHECLCGRKWIWRRSGDDS